MQKAALAARDQVAQERIVKAAQALAEKFGLSEHLMSGLRIQERDRLVKAMKEREAVADLLEALAQAGKTGKAKDVAA